MISYINGKLMLISLIFGSIVTLISQFFVEFGYSIIIGAIATILFSLLIAFLLYKSDEILLKLKKAINKPLIVDERAIYMTSEKLDYGLFVATDDELYFMLKDENTPKITSVKKGEVIKLSITDDNFLNIFIDRKNCIRLQCNYVDRVLETLKDNGFGV